MGCPRLEQVSSTALSEQSFRNGRGEAWRDKGNKGKEGVDRWGTVQARELFQNTM